MLNAEYFGRNYPASVAMLMDAGINYEDACALRRISMTLHRWHELECGDSNDYRSVALVRGYQLRDENKKRVFIYDETKRPYLETHAHHAPGAVYSPIADRERGAIKRLDKIMARYPGFARYIQTDPRGCALYILTRDQVSAIEESGSSIDSSYNRGIAVFK